MNVNFNLQGELIKQFGSQVKAAKAMGITESRVSHIVGVHVQPSERERKLSDKANRWNGKNSFPWRKADI